MAGVDVELLDELLGTLDNRGRYAVEARFGFLDGERKSFREVGEQLGITAEAARRLVNRAIADAARRRRRGPRRLTSTTIAGVSLAAGTGPTGRCQRLDGHLRARPVIVTIPTATPTPLPHGSPAARDRDCTEVVGAIASPIRANLGTVAWCGAAGRSAQAPEGAAGRGHDGGRARPCGHRQVDHRAPLAARLDTRRVGQSLEPLADLPYHPLSHALTRSFAGLPADVAGGRRRRVDGRTLVVEDAHWADAATLDVLALFAGRVPLVVTSRSALALERPSRGGPRGATARRPRRRRPGPAAAPAPRPASRAQRSSTWPGGNPLLHRSARDRRRRVAHAGRRRAVACRASPA